MMVFDAYQEQMVRTWREGKLLNHILGLAGETGEVAELIKKAEYHGRTYEPETMISELGDVLWYLTALCEDHGLQLGQVAQANIDKLKKRYPDGFVKGGGIRE